MKATWRYYLCLAMVLVLVLVPALTVSAAPAQPRPQSAGEATAPGNPGQPNNANQNNNQGQGQDKSQDNQGKSQADQDKGQGNQDNDNGQGKGQGQDQQPNGNPGQGQGNGQSSDPGQGNGQNGNPGQGPKDNPQSQPNGNDNGERRTGSVQTQREGGFGQPGDRGQNANGYAAGESLYLSASDLQPGDYYVLVVLLGPGAGTSTIATGLYVGAGGTFLDANGQPALVQIPNNYPDGNYRVEIVRSDGTRVASDNFHIGRGGQNGDDPGTGNNPGGDDPGNGDNPGGGNPGGDNPGTNNPGGDNPGGNNPGADNPGNGNPGGNNPGDGGNQPGDDGSVPGDSQPGIGTPPDTGARVGNLPVIKVLSGQSALSATVMTSYAVLGLMPTTLPKTGEVPLQPLMLVLGSALASVGGLLRRFGGRD
ncbi:MAG: hypothetical protein M1401_18965 [Chloroflexi bacterium]|nr:hypothetical protein [Chloroflexota bacterium]